MILTDRKYKHAFLFKQKVCVLKLFDDNTCDIADLIFSAIDIYKRCNIVSKVQYLEKKNNIITKKTKLTFK